MANEWQLDGASFSAIYPADAWIGRSVSLKNTEISSRRSITVGATTVNAAPLRIPDGAQLSLHSTHVDLSGSEFTRPTIVGPPPNPVLPTTVLPQGIKRRYQYNARLSCAIEANEQAEKLRRSIAGVLGRAHECRIVSLERCTTDNLVLAATTLDDCRFADAQGLDKLRIGADCSFQHVPAWWLRWRSFTPRRLLARRRILADEISWRRASTGPKKQRAAEDSALSAAQVAGIYRALRKGLEDSKNEPDASDFYYGEMEMRRLGGRRFLTSRLLHGRRAAHVTRASTSVMELMLLHGYWAVSGYGLRAWRALTALAVVIVAAAFLFTHPGLATVIPPVA